MNCVSPWYHRNGCMNCVSPWHHRNGCLTGTFKTNYLPYLCRRHVIIFHAENVHTVLSCQNKERSFFNLLWVSIDISLPCPRREAGDFWCLLPVWNLRAFSLILLFYISSFVFLPIILLLFLSYLFLLLAYSPDFFFPKPPFFEWSSFVWLLFFVLFLSDQEMSILVGGMCSICYHMTLIYIAFMHCI